jgi:hypothetical protein
MKTMKSWLMCCWCGHRYSRQESDPFVLSSLPKKIIAENSLHKTNSLFAFIFPDNSFIVKWNSRLLVLLVSGPPMKYLMHLRDTSEEWAFRIHQIQPSMTHPTS